jgi:DNA-directed RNA polymerase specialized sigma24 family protein
MQQWQSRFPDTSIGMLQRVQGGDEDAWTDFANRCGSVIQEWCKWRHLQSLEADDIIQNTMIIVLKKVHSFRHAGRGSLRAWLRAIAWRCWCDAAARANRLQLEELQGNYEVAIDEIAILEKQYEELSRLELIQRAMVLVRQRVRASTWEMFYRTALGNECGNTVAADLKVSVHVVYAARSRVQRLLHQEVSMLGQHEGVQYGFPGTVREAATTG